MNDYLQGLKEVFERNSIKEVYSHGRFEKEPMRNPVLYVYMDTDPKIKEDVLNYLREVSIGHEASFSMTKFMPPKAYELIYKNGEFI